MTKYGFTASVDTATDLQSSRISDLSILYERTCGFSVGDDAISYVETLGRSSIGDGGAAVYKRVIAEPLAGIQSADGVWWELVPDPSAGIAVEQFGAAGDNSTDDTVAINNAIAAASALNVSRVLLSKRYVIEGTIEVQKGVVLQGHAKSGPYFLNFPMSDGSVLRRPNGVSTSGMVELDQTAAIAGVVLDYEETGGCPEGIIHYKDGVNITYTVIEDVSIQGQKVATVAPASACIGIRTGVGSGSAVRYFNRISKVFINNCDIAGRFENQFNANNVDTWNSINCHLHIDMDGDDGAGGGECIENTFSGLVLSGTAALSPTAIAFRLANQARGNVFSGWTTEVYGQAFDHPWDNTCDNNDFSGFRTNEPTPTYVEPRPGGLTSITPNFDSRYGRPTNIHQYRSMMLPTLTTTSRFVNISGATADTLVRIEGTLPTQNAASGTLTAANSAHRVFWRFGDAWTKQKLPTAKLSLTLTLNRSNGAETVVGKINFWVRKVSSSQTETISSITQANPGVVTTSASHGLSNGDPIFIASGAGGGMVELEGRHFDVANVTATTFELQTPGAGSANVDTTAYTAHSSGGTIQTNQMELIVESATIYENSAGVVLKGLHFLTGRSDAENFGLAVSVGGGSANSLNYMTVELDIGHNTFDSDVAAHPDIVIPSSVTSAAADASDVADAIDLLTAATTVF